MTPDSKQLARAEFGNTDRVSTRVVTYLCTLIDIGELQAGDQLPSERELARRVKVSRASVRTGIAFLGFIGVLKSCHGTGTYVSLRATSPRSDSTSAPRGRQRPISSHLLEARRLIEGIVVGLAAERSTSKHQAELAEHIAEMYAALNDPEKYFFHNVRFHRTIARAAGNEVLDALLETLAANIYDSRPRGVQSPQNLKQFVETYHEIYKAIRSRNPSRAKLLVEQHLDGACPPLEDGADPHPSPD
jgi:GntR family transcriptional regulator, transcriptional repressor for pyruvate dehydrogenase complex